MAFRAGNFAEARLGDRRIVAGSAAPVSKAADSPYSGLQLNDRHAVAAVTRGLLESHPLDAEAVVNVVEWSWNAIFDSTIGPARIGVDLFPSPQVMGMFLHELVPLQCRESFGDDWRNDRTAAEKDMVFVPDSTYSTEIKTSSSDRNIYGNRSYGQQGLDLEKKKKSGYYIAVNFAQWETDATGAPLTPQKPDIKLIRMGWLDHTDWHAQAAQSGQQSSLAPMTENTQLLTLYAHD